mmetsp:Transcript_24752/g.60022  ORF Transcript_24752/g.60022 Transcript_24752/m.60022 type:complete len:249 (-) Transcript_24752:1124-1870(-)
MGAPIVAHIALASVRRIRVFTLGIVALATCLRTGSSKIGLCAILREITTIVALAVLVNPLVDTFTVLAFLRHSCVLRCRGRPGGSIPVILLRSNRSSLGYDQLPWNARSSSNQCCGITFAFSTSHGTIRFEPIKFTESRERRTLVAPVELLLPCSDAGLVGTRRRRRRASVTRLPTEEIGAPTVVVACFLSCHHAFRDNACISCASIAISIDPIRVVVAQRSRSAWLIVIELRCSCRPSSAFCLICRR